METAEVIGLTPGTPVRLALNDGRDLSADAVVLASGRPQSGMPDSLERAFAPVRAEGTDGRVVLDPWAPGALAALGARRPASVLVIGSGLTGVDVALHLTARGRADSVLPVHRRSYPTSTRCLPRFRLSNCAPRSPPTSRTLAMAAST